MNSATFDMERGIARCRVLLSVTAILALVRRSHRTDAHPLAAAHRRPLRHDPYWVSVLLAHLGLQPDTGLMTASPTSPPPRLAAIATCGDVLFAAAIALVTEGTTSPFYAFFAFAVLSAGLRSGLRAALSVTAVSVAFYIVLIVLSAPGQSALLRHARRVPRDHGLPRRLSRPGAAEPGGEDPRARGERPARADRALAARRLRAGARRR